MDSSSPSMTQESSHSMVESTGTTLPTELEVDASQLDRGAPLDLEDPLKEKETQDDGLPEVLTYPDGGTRAWLAVLGAWTLSFSTFGYSNAWGVFQAYYAQELFPDQKQSTISWIGSTQLFFQFACGLFSGPLFDNGYFRPMMTAGSILMVFCLFMLSLCTEFWQAFLAQAIGWGLGSGVLFVPSLSAVSHYFLKKRGLAMGFCVVGSTFGGVIWPIMLNRLFISKGFAFAVRISACILIATLLLGNTLLRPRFPGRRKKSAKPPITVVELFSSLEYALAVFGSTFVGLGLFFPIFYLQVWMENNHVRTSITLYSVAMLNAGSFVGRTVPNFFADKIGPFNALIPCCGISGILIFAMFGATSEGGSIAFAVLYGIFTGAYVSVAGPAMASLAKDISDMGKTIGWAFVTAGLGVLACGPVNGALLAKANNQFYAPVIFSGCTVQIGVGFLIVVRQRLVKERGTWRV
ncbi:MFS general substrate transporter [Meredithblackwellia eburnea MCA 4105]